MNILFEDFQAQVIIIWGTFQNQKSRVVFVSSAVKVLAIESNKPGLTDSHKKTKQ